MLNITIRFTTKPRPPSRKRTFKQAALEEINYLQSIIYGIEQAANDNELKEIHQELTEQLYPQTGQISKIQKQAKKASNISAKEKSNIFSTLPLYLPR